MGNDSRIGGTARPESDVVVGVALMPAVDSEHDWAMGDMAAGSVNGAINGRQPEVDRSLDGLATLLENGLPLDVSGRPPIAANDNHLTWPFIPFPEGRRGP
jgi:hypothetical protein